jgi:hypothetical protein
VTHRQTYAQAVPGFTSTRKKEVKNIHPVVRVDVEKVKICARACDPEIHYPCQGNEDFSTKPSVVS